MKYRLRVMPCAARDFDRLPASAQARIAECLRELPQDPRPSGAAALAGELKGHLRVRIGRYRVAYHVDDEARLISVWQIGTRSRFYEKAARRRTRG